MLPKLDERKEAVSLRMKGYSLNEISNHLGISKSSASLWLGNVTLGRHALKRIQKKRSDAYRKSAQKLREQTSVRLNEAAALAEDTLSEIKLELPHFQVMCALLYWCEGE